jgi:hypothetical protein
VFAAGGDWAEVSHTVLRSRVIAVDKAGCGPNMIEDPTMRVGPGIHGHVEGLAAGMTETTKITLPLSSLGAAPAIGVAPTHTPVTLLLSTWAQAVDAFLAQACAGVPTTTFVPVADHSPAGASGFGVALFGVTVGGVANAIICPRMFVDDGGDLYLTMALPDAPVAAADTVYGGFSMPMAGRPDPPVTEGCSVGVRIREGLEILTEELLGAVATSWTIPETDATELQPIEFSLGNADWEHPVIGAARVDPGASDEYCAAGGQVLLAAHGSTVTTSVSALRVVIESGGLTMDRSVGDETGCGGVTRSTDLPTVTITIPDEVAPPAACAAASWREMFEENRDPANDMQILVAKRGHQPGRAIIYGEPHCRLDAMPEHISDNEVGFLKLTFRPVPEPTQSLVGTAAVESAIVGAF